MAALGGSPGGGAVTTLFVHEACAALDGASCGDAQHSPQTQVPTPPRREADGGDSGTPCEAGAQSRTLYTRDTLASALCLMGAKPRHSLKVAARVFDTLGVLARRLQLPVGSGGATATAGLRMLPHRLPRPVVRAATFGDGAAELPRPQFEALVAWALAEYQYAKPDQLEDLRLACRRVARRGKRAAPRADARLPQDTRAPDCGVCAAVRHERDWQVDARCAAGALMPQVPATRQRSNDAAPDSCHRRHAWASQPSFPQTSCAAWCVVRLLSARRAQLTDGAGHCRNSCVALLRRARVRCSLLPHIRRVTWWHIQVNRTRILTWLSASELVRYMRARA